MAELLAVAPSTIWNWHRRYRAAGLAGLINQAKSGRPAKADVAYLDALARALAADPRTLGYTFSVWTINNLRHYLEQQTGILLSKQGYVYRQPKHDLSELQDEQAKAAAKELLDWLKKSPVPTTPSSSSLWTKRV